MDDNERRQHIAEEYDHAISTARLAAMWVQCGMPYKGEGELDLSAANQQLEATGRRVQAAAEAYKAEFGNYPEGYEAIWPK